MKVNGTLYENVKFGVMRGLCTDALIGIDFLKRHDSVTMKYGGKLPEL